MFSRLNLARFAQKSVRGYAAAAGHEVHEGGMKKWKMLSIFVGGPAVIITTINAYLGEVEHKKHFHRVPFKPYEHLRKREKKFPWGDGNKTLFHNPKVNPLPEGYEDEL